MAEQNDTLAAVIAQLENVEPNGPELLGLIADLVEVLAAYGIDVEPEDES